MQTSFMDEFKTWWGQPYTGAQNMSALQWFLLFGLAICIAGSWRIILSHIEA